MRYLLMPLLTVLLSGVLVVGTNEVVATPTDDIFGPFDRDYVTTCTHGEKVRKVGVHYLHETESVPCEVRYYKPTELPDEDYRVLWRARNTEGYCERKGALLVRRLRGWGWQCGQAEATGASSDSNSDSDNDSNSTGNRSDSSSGSTGNSSDDNSSGSTDDSNSNCNRYGGYYCGG